MTVPVMRSASMRRVRTCLSPYLLALPAMLLMALFMVGTFTGVAQGFGIMPFLGRMTPTLEYVQRAVARPDFVSALRFSLLVSTASSLVALVGGVALAAGLSYGRFGRRVQMVALQLPIMTMHALVALALTFMLSGSGLFARLLCAAGIISDPRALPTFVGAPSGWGIVLVYAWKEIPYVAFVTLTLMRHVSSSLGEAASCCGANSRQTFFHVVLPLCLPAALRALIVVFVFSLGSYEVPFLLGPTAPKALPVLAYIEFTNPDITNRCYAMAIDGITTGICLVAAAIYVTLLQIDRRRKL